MVPLPEQKKRSHYQTQREQSYAHFRVRPENTHKINALQYTVYDFVNDTFTYSQTRKELAAAVLQRLKASPATFTQLVTETEAGKSTLYLLLLSLEKSGLVEKGGKKRPYQLSTSFSGALEQNASWWRSFAEKQTFTPPK